MDEPADPYLVLGLNDGATPREISRAYRSGVRRYHPDTLCPGASSPASRESTDKALARVMEAYQALSRPSVGAERGRAGGSPSPQQWPADQPSGDRSQSHHVTVRQHTPRLVVHDTPPIQISPLRWEPSN